jgi:hypothetical protein
MFYPNDVNKRESGGQGTDTPYLDLRPRQTESTRVNSRNSRKSLRFLLFKNQTEAGSKAGRFKLMQGKKSSPTSTFMPSSPGRKFIMFFF